MKLANLPEYSLFVVKSSSLIKKLGKFNGAETKVMNGRVFYSIIFTPNTRQVLPKLQSIIEFLSLNLSDLCNKISLCNIIDNSAAKNSIKKGRLYKEKENEFVMFML